MSKLKPRDMEILQCLDAAIRTDKTEWVTPLSCGGYNGSDHSYRLRKLSRMGLAECRKKGWWGRGSNIYRMTAAGQEQLTNE